MPFVERIARAGATALVTTGTVTSAALLARRLPAGALHQYAPLDSPFFLRRFLRHWRPDAALVAESELWPNMIVETKRAGLPLAMVNGRISERSFNRWRKGAARSSPRCSAVSISASRGARPTASGSSRSARRASAIAGDIKYDAPALPADRRELAELSGLVSGRQIWIAASTHAGEERIAARAHKRLAEVFPDALTLIAPRHPERGEAILRETRGGGAALRAAVARRAAGARTRVYICDTIGELGLFYRLAGVVFVGKSFAGGGGQNPIEPARLASAILHGPHGRQFRRRLRAARRCGRRGRGRRAGRARRRR